MKGGLKSRIKMKNPFILWGSYIGALFGVPATLLIIRKYSFFINPLIILIIFIVLGFIVGGGIHNYLGDGSDKHRSKR